MMSCHRSLIAALSLFVFAAPLAAQRVTRSAASPTSDAAVVTLVVVADSAPSFAAAAPTLTRNADQLFLTAARDAPAPTNIPMAAGAAKGRNAALMLFGGAALVVGSVIGGDAGNIIMIGGGVVALVGLWRYLQ